MAHSVSVTTRVTIRVTILVTTPLSAVQEVGVTTRVIVRVTILVTVPLAALQAVSGARERVKSKRAPPFAARRREPLPSEYGTM